MKYIKLYESKKIKDKEKSYYWILPSDERFFPSLEKIKCPKKAQKEFRQDMQYIDMQKFVIVYYSAIEDINPWRLASYSLLDLFEESEDYIFGGYINIEDYEIEANKYNL